MAQKQELTDAQKSWFRQLANHELGERYLMGQGIPYRRIESWNLTIKRFDTPPSGAQDLAPTQPGFGIYPGYSPKF
ncbi:hypothetical protein SOASR030_04680 [Leminorella grimontii]|uniref:Uncharacterized protein n=1 Tax=Leminorella grimontii TaxID=82981 RepID=A0AAV5MX05_9GAMM|nr:hypothetical protein SOASR030_04680 [Leminorella grimontii]